MEKMKPLLYDADQLKEYFRHIECAAIYGAGDYGKTLIDYLISAGEEEKILGIIVTKRKDADCNSDAFQKNPRLPGFPFLCNYGRHLWNIGMRWKRRFYLRAHHIEL